MGIEPIVRNLFKEDLEALLNFTDTQIGKGYFSRKKAMALIENSWTGKTCSSLVLERTSVENPEKNEIVGIRLAFGPGRWTLSHPSQDLHPEMWDVDLKDMAYFQSQFLHPDYQGQGWGVRLSQLAIERVASMGAKAIVCHSWNESPHNSSRKYLERVGFVPIIEVPLFWNKIDYHCTGCNQKPCVCSATEMVYYL